MANSKFVEVKLNAFCYKQNRTKPDSFGKLLFPLYYFSYFDGNILLFFFYVFFYVSAPCCGEVFSRFGGMYFLHLQVDNWF